MTATATLVTPRAPRRVAAGSKRSSSVVVAFVALLLIGMMLAPVIYIILGGFRSNAEITVDPAGFPTVWNWQNYADVLGSGVFWDRSATPRSPRSPPPCSSSPWA